MAWLFLYMCIAILCGIGIGYHAGVDRADFGWNLRWIFISVLLWPVLLTAVAVWVKMGWKDLYFGGRDESESI